MHRSILLVVFACLLGFPSCGNLLKKDEKNNSGLLLLLGLASLNNSCQNQTGLVICIPPGVPN